MDVDPGKRRDQRVHVDDGHASVDHAVDRGGQRADAERLDGDEIPFLRRHVVDRRALLLGGEFAVEPGDLDVVELTPILGGLLALRAPRRLQPGVTERRLQRFPRPAGGFTHVLGQRWTDSECHRSRGSMRQ